MGAESLLKSANLSCSWHVKWEQSCTLRYFICGMSTAQRWDLWPGVHPSAEHIPMARLSCLLISVLFVCLFLMFLGYLKYGHKVYEVKSPNTLAHKTSVSCLTQNKHETRIHSVWARHLRVSCCWKVTFFPLKLRSFIFTLLQEGFKVLSTEGNVRTSLHTVWLAASCCWKACVAPISLPLTPATQWHLSPGKIWSCTNDRYCANTQLNASRCFLHATETTTALFYLIFLCISRKDLL